MLDQFEQAATAIGATIKRFTILQEAADYVTALCGGELAASDLPDSIRSALSGVTYVPFTSYKDVKVGVSYAEAGIAATGSLILNLADPVKRSATALPPIHAVFLKASTILADIYAAQDLLNQALGNGNAYYSITTGPSRTADIERVLTIGVHGPKELHILILENE